MILHHLTYLSILLKVQSTQLVNNRNRIYLNTIEILKLQIVDEDVITEDNLQTDPDKSDKAIGKKIIKLLNIHRCGRIIIRKI